MKKTFVIVSSALAMAACAVQAPPNSFVLTPELLQQRQLETRRYDGVQEGDLLAASSNVLQDLGFNLENSESKLGVLTASKERDATNAGEIAAAVVVALLGGGAMAISKDQTIRVALVVCPAYDSNAQAMTDKHLVRVTFQRVVRKTDGSTVLQTLNDKALYEEFYDKLSKSVFLEAHKV